jgi:two-component system chemotaxis response regulator CheY
MTSDGSAAILIIDGNRQDREHSATLLRNSSPDYEIFQAGDGKSGLERCQARVFDCVVLELDLPDMSGLEVLRELVAPGRGPEIPVIVLTRLVSESLLSAAVLCGAQACLQKQQISADTLDRAVAMSMATVGNVWQHGELSSSA